MIRGIERLKIGLCDDNRECLETLHKELVSSNLNLPNTSIEVFYSGIDLVNQYKCGNHFDLLFLDIEMPGLSGIEAGHIIRENDSRVIIVFLTSHSQYISQSLKVEIFDYLVKPLDKNELNHVLKRAVKKYQEQHYIIEVKIHDKVHSLEVDEIITIESNKNYVTFYTIKNEYRCKGRLKEYELKLASYGFIKCHNSILINGRYIQDIEDGRIVTKTGLLVDMSIRKKKIFMREYNEYIMRHKI